MVEQSASSPVPEVLEQKRTTKDIVIIDALHLEESVLRYGHEVTGNGLNRLLPFYQSWCSIR